jgi:hypothetical protein
MFGMAMGTRDGEQEELFITHQQLRSQSPLFNIVVNGIAACFGTGRLLYNDSRIENSLARSGIATSAHVRERAAQCRNQGGMDTCVLDVSLPGQFSSEPFS